jgi:hypothetical protein
MAVWRPCGVKLNAGWYFVGCVVPAFTAGQFGFLALTAATSLGSVSAVSLRPAFVFSLMIAGVCATSACPPSLR